MESLWKDVVLNRHKMSMFEVDDEMAGIKMDRFNSKQIIKSKDYIEDSIDMEEVQKRNFTRNIFKYVCSKEQVKELIMEEADLSHVEISLLMGSILKLEIVNFKYSKVAKNDLIIIVSLIPFSQSLKSINLSSMDISNISPRMLQEAAKSLENLQVNHSRLNADQCKSLINGMKNNHKMTSLGLGGQQSLKLLSVEMLASLISQNMKSLDLSETNLNPCQLEAILKQISRLPTMSNLYLKRSNFTKVDTEILAEALSNIEDLGLMQTEFGKGQVDVLFKQILHKQKTKEINLYEVNLKDVDKNLFAETLKTVKVVVLSFTIITFDQMTSLLIAISKGSKVRTLYMNQDLMCKVEAHLLCAAIITLEYVCLMNTGLPRGTVTELISQGLKSKRLKKMLCSGIILTNLKPATLKPSALHLMSANLDSAQLKRLLPEYARAGVRELKLNNSNFTEVDLELLTQNIYNLTFLDLSFAKLKKDQLTSLLHTIKNAENLKELVLTGMDLSLVSLQVLKESVCNVRKVSVQKNFLDKLSEVELLREGLRSSKMKHLNLRYLKMSSSNGDFCVVCEHFNSIEATMLLEMVKDNSKVTELIMTGDDLSQIDEELLFQTILKLKSVSLIGTNLTIEQLTRIVSAAFLSDSLESLNLSSNNLSELPANQLVRATLRMQVLVLESTRLTKQQCIAVITGATTSSRLKFLNLNLVGAEWNFSLTPNLPEEISVVLNVAKKKEDLYIKWDFYSQ
eukprot:GFUD01021812.1.p1 GENE.GFUD01021812.1~~GFUD01021812.1.p1  ORF type:complete len:794 (-),score=153.72 GFUD01021812.1:126-2345(-)